MGLLKDALNSYLTFVHQAAVADTPASGRKLLYFKSDGKLYKKDSSDVETEVGAGGNSFETIAVSGQSDVVAESATDTLTLVAGSNVTLTTDAGTDSITIAAAAGGGGDFLVVQVFS